MKNKTIVVKSTASPTLFSASELPRPREQHFRREPAVLHILTTVLEAWGYMTFTLSFNPCHCETGHMIHGNRENVKIHSHSKAFGDRQKQESNMISWSLNFIFYAAASAYSTGKWSKQTY
jgi:hypothetical protein